jgi:hypothetical protein
VRLALLGDGRNPDDDRRQTDNHDPALGILSFAMRRYPMKDDSKNSFWLLVQRVMLALIFALLAILSTRLSHLGIRHSLFTINFGLSWLFWFFIAVSGLCILPIVNGVFSSLHNRGALPAFLDFLYQERFRNHSAKVMLQIRTVASRLEGQLVLVAVGIFLLMMLLAKTGAIDNDRVDGAVYEFVSSLTSRPGTNLREPVVVEYMLPVGNCDSATYLNRYRETLKIFREAGVKAVMIDSRHLKGEMYTLMQALREFDFVVYGLGYFKSVGMVLPYARMAEFTKGIYSLEPDETVQLQSIGNTGPAQVRQVVYLDKIPVNSLPFGKGEVRDLSLELFHKYVGTNVEFKLDTNENELVLADCKIPVTSDGWMYSRIRRRFIGWAYSTKAWTSVHQAVMAREYVQADRLNKLKGKIIFLRESGQNLFGYATGDRLRYGHILTNLIEREFLRKSESGHVWFVLICLALSALIAYRIRPLAAFLLILIVAVCTILLGAYFYNSLHVIIDIFFPVLATAVAMVVFPLLSLESRLRGVDYRSPPEH